MHEKVLKRLAWVGSAKAKLIVSQGDILVSKFEDFRIQWIDKILSLCFCLLRCKAEEQAENTCDRGEIMVGVASGWKSSFM